MFSERGGFRPPEENPTKATPEEIGSMLEESLQESAPTIGDMVLEELNKINEENLLSGKITPKEFVKQTIQAIRMNPANRAFADDINQIILARTEIGQLSEEQLIDGVASIVGIWLQSKIEGMKKSDVEKAQIPLVLNDGLAEQISSQLEKMKTLTRVTKEKAEDAAKKREWLEGQKGKQSV
ncbi:MAG: hypothetical protein AAB444_01225 [Patescibacteria group bacterium]